MPLVQDSVPPSSSYPRLGVVPPSYSPIPAERIIRDHRPVHLIPPPVRRSLQARRLLDLSPLTPASVIAAGRGDRALPSLELAQEAAQHMARLRHNLAAAAGSDLSSDRSLILTANVDELEKYIPQMGFCPGALIPPQLHSKPGFAGLRDEVVNAFRDVFLAAPAVEPALKLKRGTSHGFPSFSSGDIDHVAHLAMAQEVSGTKDIQALVSEAADIIGFPDLVQDGMPLLIGSRTGPIRKPQDMAAWVLGEAHFTVRTVGIFPRRRMIRIYPTFANEVARYPVMRAIATLKRSLLAHCFAFTTPAVTARRIAHTRAVNRRTSTWSDDASNFDDTVDKRLVEQACYAVGFDPFITALAVESVTSPLLGGPLNAGDAASLFRRSKGIASGTIFTTLLGTIINFLCVVDALSLASRRSPASVLLSLASWQELVFIQGDDTLMQVLDFDHDVYLERMAQLGLSRKLEPYPIFLKTFYFADGTFSNLAGRACIACLTREHRAPGPYSETAAMAIRLEACQRDPAFPMVMMTLRRSNALFRRFSIESFADLQRFVALNATTIQKEYRSTAQGPEAARRLADDLSDFMIDGATDLSVTSFLIGTLGLVRTYADEFVSLDKIASDARTFDWRAYLKLQARRWERDPGAADEEDLVDGFLHGPGDANDV